MKIDTYTLPARWASALINGDWSGLEEDDVQAAQKFMADLPKGTRCICLSEDTWDDVFEGLFQTVGTFSFIMGERA